MAVAHLDGKDVWGGVAGLGLGRWENHLACVLKSLKVSLYDVRETFWEAALRDARETCSPAGGCLSLGHTSQAGKVPTGKDADCWQPHHGSSDRKPWKQEESPFLSQCCFDTICNINAGWQRRSVTESCPITKGGKRVGLELRGNKLTIGKKHDLQSAL